MSVTYFCEHLKALAEGSEPPPTQGPVKISAYSIAMPGTGPLGAETTVDTTVMLCCRSHLATERVAASYRLDMVSKTQTYHVQAINDVLYGPIRDEVRSAVLDLVQRHKLPVDDPAMQRLGRALSLCDWTGGSAEDWLPRPIMGAGAD